MSLDIVADTAFIPVKKKIRHLRIALFGFGVVGTGVWEVLEAKRNEFRKQFSTEIEIAGICVRDAQKPRLTNAPRSLITNSPEQLLEADGIDIVIELIGGRYEAAGVIEHALQSRKHVITANKLVLAHELPD